MKHFIVRLHIKVSMCTDTLWLAVSKAMLSIPDRDTLGIIPGSAIIVYRGELGFEVVPFGVLRVTDVSLYWTAL